jgi:signal peptidase II
MQNDSGNWEVGSGEGADTAPSSHFPLSNSKVFWPVLIAIVAGDVVTKLLAVSKLEDFPRVPHPVLGDWVRLTLVYNPGAAFGLHVGEYSRWVFIALTVAALVILGRLYISTRRGDTLRVTSLALVCGGALGNLIDRVRHQQGVVDFLDLGIGDSRWPTFNVADIAVSMGAFLLAIVLWQEDRPSRDASAPPIGLVPGGELRHESGDVS